MLEMTDMSETVTACLVAGGALGSIGLLYLAICGAVVRHCRLQMRDYELFIRRTYIEENKAVPVLVMRYYKMCIDRYNRACRHAPFRYFMHRVPTDNLHERFPVLQRAATACTVKPDNVKHKKHFRK
ncbi:MAG: hypothetical protein ACI35T_07985 [Alistipes sp.]